MKNCFEIYENRVFAGRDEVLAVKVRCLEYIQEGEVCPLSLEKALQFLQGSARVGSDKFGPTVAAAIQDSQAAQSWMATPLIYPVQKFLEVFVHGHRLWLVHQLRTRTECRDHHASAAAVTVALKTQAGDVARLSFVFQQRGAKHFPVRGQPIYELEKKFDPLIDSYD